MSLGNQTRVTGSEIVVPYTSSSSTFEAYQLTTNFVSNSAGNDLTLAGTWLARQATLFNKYKIDRCALRYVPFCPTTTQGRVILAWTGDPGDGNPSSAQQLSQYQNSVEAPVWREVSCNAMISRLPEYRVIGDTGDATRDQGSFYFACDNGPTTAVPVGTFYLDYDVRFWSRAAFDNNK